MSPPYLDARWISSDMELGLGLSQKLDWATTRFVKRKLEVGSVALLEFRTTRGFTFSFAWKLMILTIKDLKAYTFN